MDEKAKKELRARQLEALTLKTYKVSVITMGMHNFTILAAGDKDAVDKVMEGHGRDAGKENPIPFAHRVQDMSIVMPPVTLQQVMAEVMQGQAGAKTGQSMEPQPKIIVPGA